MAQHQKQWAQLPKHYRYDGYLIAQFMPEGLDLFIGAKHDPEMGPVIVFGSGGIDVEFMQDSAVAPIPLSIEDAHALIGRTKVGKKLRGLRGKAPSCEASVIHALMNLSHLMSDGEGHIAAVDINPFRVDATKGLALDGGDMCSAFELIYTCYSCLGGL